MGKVKALAAAGVVEGIPAEILDAQGGELYALAVVGAFVGCDTTAGIEMRKAMLASKMDERMLVVLDEVDAMLDSESETDALHVHSRPPLRTTTPVSPKGTLRHPSLGLLSPCGGSWWWRWWQPARAQMRDLPRSAYASPTRTALFTRVSEIPHLKVNAREFPARCLPLPFT